MPKPNAPTPAPDTPPGTDETPPPKATQRIAKLLARAGVASRREIERMIDAGRVALDGTVLTTPATLLASLHGVTVDGVPVKAPAPARLFLFHKPPGFLTAAFDPQGRRTIYHALPEDLPRVMPVGRLDLNTEGLLLLTTDGELKRQLELPASGVERTYRARAYGEITQAQLEDLIDGIEIEGMRYGAIDANLERRTGANVWVEMTLTEGKNREVRRVLEHLGLQVSRLIRTRYGPFVLADLPPGEVVEVRQHDLITFRKSLGLPPAKRSPLRFETKVPTPAPRPAAAEPAPEARRPAVEPEGRRRLPRPTPVKIDAPRRDRDERTSAPRARAGAAPARDRGEELVTRRADAMRGARSDAPRKRDDRPERAGFRARSDAPAAAEERKRGSFGDRARARHRARTDGGERSPAAERGHAPRGEDRQRPAQADRARAPRRAHDERPQPDLARATRGTGTQRNEREERPVGTLSRNARPPRSDDRPPSGARAPRAAGPQRGEREERPRSPLTRASRPQRADERPRGTSDGAAPRSPRPQGGRDRPAPGAPRGPRSPGPKRPGGGGKR